MLLHFLYVFLFSNNDPGLRTAQKLIPGKADHIRSFSEDFPYCRLMGKPVFFQINQNSASQINDHRNPVFFSQSRKLLHRGFFCKSHNLIIACMDLQKCRSFFCYCRFIVRTPGPVGAAGFPKEGAALLHNLRDTEMPSDLNQLSSGNNHFFFVRHSRKN